MRAIKGTLVIEGITPVSLSNLNINELNEKESN